MRINERAAVYINTELYRMILIRARNIDHLNSWVPFGTACHVTVSSGTAVFDNMMQSRKIPSWKTLSPVFPHCTQQNSLSNIR